MNSREVRFRPRLAGVDARRVAQACCRSKAAHTGSGILQQALACMKQHRGAKPTPGAVCLGDHITQGFATHCVKQRDHMLSPQVTLIACRVHVITCGDDTSNKPTTLSCIKYIAPQDLYTPFTAKIHNHNILFDFKTVRLQPAEVTCIESHDCLSFPQLDCKSAIGLAGVSARNI